MTLSKGKFRFSVGPSDRLRLAIIAVLALAAPAAIGAQCIPPSSRPYALLASYKGIVSGTTKTFKVDISSLDSVTQGLTRAAFDKWNAVTSTSRVQFDYSGGGGPYDFEVKNDNSVTGIDKCAAAFGYPIINPAPIKLSNDFIASAANADMYSDSSGSEQLTMTIAHEIGHLLGLDEDNTSNNLMKQHGYHGTESCLDEEHESGNARPTSVDVAGNAAKCTFGSTSTGDGDGNDEKPYDNGQTCNIYYATVHYECSWDDGYVSCTATDWSIWGSPIQSCSGGPPEV